MALDWKTHETFTVGLDLGFANDYSTLAVVRTQKYSDPLEGVDVFPPQPVQVPPPVHEVVHAERIPLKTPYPDVVDTTAEILARDDLKRLDKRRRWVDPALVVDATGVGQPVVQLFRKKGIRPVAVTITGGDRVTQEGRDFKVPKRDLISGCQVLLQSRVLESRRLKFAPTMAFADVVTREFERYQMRIDLQTGHDSYGQWREGEHDDLVLGVALAVWYAEHQANRKQFVMFGQG